MDKIKGEVRVLNVQRGFGFIAAEDRRDYFFHFNNVLKGTISPQRFVVGDLVTFNVIENEDLKKNPQAVDVAFVKAGNGQTAQTSFATIADTVTTTPLEP